jgi:hypothetical protein
VLRRTHVGQFFVHIKEWVQRLVLKFISSSEIAIYSKKYTYNPSVGIGQSF